MYKCCLYSGEGNYKDIESHLELFVGRFDFEREIRPFMCSYRNWALFIIDTNGMRPSRELEMLEATVKLVRSYPARIVGFWSNDTWQKFVNLADRDQLESENCIRLESPDWCNKLAKAIKRYERQNRG